MRSKRPFLATPTVRSRSKFMVSVRSRFVARRYRGPANGRARPEAGRTPTMEDAIIAIVEEARANGSKK